MCNATDSVQKTNKMPFFSIILPIYNVEPYLEQCIHSLLDQDFSDYEMILVDDGSPDQCPEICDRYAAQYAHIHVVHKPNGGLSSARNAGLEVAQGQYVWFVDSDDWVEPNSMQVLYNACCDGMPDVVKFNFAQNGSEEIQVANGIAPGDYDAQDRGLLLDMAFLKTGKFSLSAWSHIYRQAFLQQNKLLFVSERVIGSEDFLFNLHTFAVAGQVRIINDSLYHYRMRAGSLTQRYRSKLFQQYTELYTRLKECYAELGLLEDCTARISFFYVWCMVHGTCFSHEYRCYDGHTLSDGRKNVRRILKSPFFCDAAKKCCRKHFTKKQWLQLQAVRLRLEPVFYWLYVAKPKRQKGLRHETKNSAA